MPVILILTFFSTLSVYNFAVWRPHKNENWRIFLAVGALLPSIGLSLNFLPFHSILVLGILAFFSFMYSLPFEKLGLRWIPFFKIILIAFIWVNVLVLFPYLHGNYLGLALDWDILLYVSLLMFVFGITVPFDIRDMKKDPKNLKTIPQIFGLQKAKLISIISLVMSLVLFGLSSTPNLEHKVAFSLTCLVGVLLSLFSSPKKNKWYFTFWVEGLSALPFIIYILLLQKN